MRQNLSDIVNNQERADRIKKARLRAGFKTARAAAAALSIPYPTYAGHENGSRGIKDSELITYANAFNVPVEWLAFGKRNSYVKSLLPLIDFFDQVSKMRNANGFHGLLEVDAPFPVPKGVSVVVVPD